MSAEATGWVFRHSPLTGAAFAVHLALADSANDQNGYELWMRQKVVASKARTSRGSVNAALGRMVNEDGTEPWPALLELLEVGSGGANRYRLLMPELPVVHETRNRRGVSATATPPTLRGVSAEATPLRAGPTGVSPHATHNPKEPKPNPTSTEGADGPAPELSAAEQRKQTAHALTTEVFDKRDPKPAQAFVAVMGVATALLKAGHPADRVLAAMLQVPTISTGWCEGVLNGRPRNGTPAPPPTQRRDAPAGRVR